MSIHKECGEEVRWARRDDDATRWRPPLEFAGVAYILSDDEAGEPRATQVQTFRHHLCDPAKVQAWQEYQERLAELREHEPPRPTNMSDWAIARERDRERAKRDAEKKKCPRCGAKKNKPCTSLAKGPHFGEEVRWPHAERMPVLPS
jgi:hypothetical protein